MNLISLVVENFRCYSGECRVYFDNLTAFVGQNDVGKSALMDALSIFFGNTSLDRDDACKSGNPELVRITCEFDQLPKELIVDTDYPTSLSDEFLLNGNKNLEIRKTFNGSLVNPKITSIEAIAEHPTVEGFNDLLLLKRPELNTRADALGVDLKGIDKRKNASVRAAIWANAEYLNLQTSKIPLDKESARQLWTALQPYLPTFALFKSDRASTDQDSEAQDPLKAAIREAVKTMEPKLIEVQEYVEREVRKIGVATVNKLREMDPTIAEALNPSITTKKWESLFQTSITGDEGIPLNKRGSGVKRLVLLNFFRAKAENDASKSAVGSIIYAIEEPETSQHPKYQRLLLSALRELSADPEQKVIITTHTPMLARYLPNENLRFIQRDKLGNRVINVGSDETSQEIASSLGVLPDHNVKAFIGVEGANDINFLRNIANELKSGGKDVVDLVRMEMNGEIIFIPLGGQNLALWASRMRHLNRPEYYICDRDDKPPKAPKYADFLEEVNSRNGCKAVCTSKREMENYLHPKAIVEAYQEDGINIVLPGIFDAFDDVPALVAETVHNVDGCRFWCDLSEKQRDKKNSRAKRMLNGRAASKMTMGRLAETDPNGEIESWLCEIQQLISQVDS